MVGTKQATDCITQSQLAIIAQEVVGRLRLERSVHALKSMEMYRQARLYICIYYIQMYICACVWRNSYHFHPLGMLFIAKAANTLEYITLAPVLLVCVSVFVCVC